jgi:3',5'-cyclic AMP phosphodiesterase CpdA
VLGRPRNLIMFSVLLLLSVSLFSLSAFFSDCQSSFQTQSEVVKQIAKFKPDNVFIGGDITYYGSKQDDFDEFFRVMKPVTKYADIFPALGNHDNDKDLFLKYFPQVDTLTYYSVDRDGIIWIILNSNLKLAPGSTQYNWLGDILEANKDRTLVVIMHHPVYSSGPHGDEKGFNLLFPALFSKYSVAAVLTGHDHIYERSYKDGVNYVVFGGGGFELYNRESKNDYSVVFQKTHGFLILSPENGTMAVKAYNIGGEVIDQFSFNIKPMVEKQEQLKQQ